MNADLLVLSDTSRRIPHHVAVEIHDPMTVTSGELAVLAIGLDVGRTALGRERERDRLVALAEVSASTELHRGTGELTSHQATLGIGER